jgi:transposase
MSSESQIKSIRTKSIGCAPILRHYFEKCKIAQIIDENAALDPRRTVLSHGQACVAMITGILCQVLALYDLCRFAENTTLLDVILPGVSPKEYFDDRLADTLDAISKHGLDNLEIPMTQHMLNEFNIACDAVHNDTTSASFYGRYDQPDTGDNINITYGFSKKHRQDLKQLVWSLSVSSDHGFPLFQQAYSGNTADVETYVEQWQNIIDLLGKSDFLFVTDSKIVTKENMAHIADNGGFFLAPVPMYESYKTVFHNALAEHTLEDLILYKKKFNRGFEVPIDIEHNEKTYRFRMIIIYDCGLFALKKHTIDKRIKSTKAAFKEMETKLNKYNLKTSDDINNACAAILSKYKTENLFEYHI